MRVLCAIPCFDEEVAVGSVVLRARRHADAVLVVDDGSADRTSEVARLAGATVLRHSENKGKGEAYRTLWRHARDQGFDALVTLDGDGQHDADEIPLLLERLAAGDDVVIGARWGTTTEMPWWRRMGKRVLDYGTAISSPAAGPAAAEGPRLTDSQSGFRAYSRRALDAIEPHQSGFSVESQMLMDAHGAGLRIGETRIHCRYDVDGSTLHSFTHATGILGDLLFQLGVRSPLLGVALPGIVLLLGGMAASVWAAYLVQTGEGLSISWLVVGLFLILAGSLAVFLGLLLAILPRGLSHALRRLLPKEG